MVKKRKRRIGSHPLSLSLLAPSILEAISGPTHEIIVEFDTDLLVFSRREEPCLVFLRTNFDLLASFLETRKNEELEKRNFGFSSRVKPPARIYANLRINSPLSLSLSGQ